MKKKIIISLFAALAAAASLFLFYKPSNMFANKPALKSGVLVYAKALTKQEAKEALGENAEKLFRGKKKKRICPIKVQITNNEFQKKSLCLDNINLKLASEGTVSQKIYNKDWPKIIGLGSIIFFGCTLLGICTGIVSASTMSIAGAGRGGGAIAASGMGAGLAFFGSSALGAGIGAIAAPTVMFVYGSKLSKRKKETSQKLFGSEEFTLEPGQTQTLYLFFQEKDCQENLELTFVDGNGKQETISCHCPLN